MPKREKPRRRYDSTRRKSQARETRRQIAAAARELFMAHGFAGTTVEAIAREARVAVETIYATFGSKRGILSHVVDISVLGDEEPTPLLQRAQIKEVEAEHDPVKQIHMFARQIAEIMSRVAPLFQVMRSVAKTDAEIAQLLDDLLAGRLHGMGHFVRALTGPLRMEADAQMTVETVWALTSAEVYNLLTADRGWSAVRYQDWLAATLVRLLLP